MTFTLLLSAALLLAPVTLARLLFLAGGRAGWAMYLANVAWETAAKAFRVSRFTLEGAAAVLGLGLLGAGGVGWGWVGGAGLALLALETVNRLWERRVLTASHARPDGTGTSPAPSTHPDLTLTLEAPFVARWPHYSLGVLWVGVPFEIELVIGNHTRVPTQTPVRATLSAPAAWRPGAPAEIVAGPIAPGTVARARWRLCPDHPADAASLMVDVAWGGETRRLKLDHDGCRPFSRAEVARAGIRRYPGGRRSAFAWRGDMDLYDTSTFQSIDGLESALGLAARYCFPQTLCLSTRLSLDDASARAWAAHYGVDRGAAEIPRFIEWLRTRVDLRHVAPYPAVTARPYLMELGNHGHLHYDTATSAAPENGWRSHARMGAGRYPWTGADASSFGEQRDNAMEARRWCERLLDFTPRTWAKPGRCNDPDTARAVAAAGCEVLSGSDIRPRDNVLRQPPPHHPGGTTAVELTTRFPCDPQHVHHLAMLLFWLHRAQRIGRPMVYMCHHHMRQFEGTACARFTEHLLRSVLTRFHGDVFVDTLFGVGKYWRDVLSPDTRCVALTWEGTRLILDNRSDMDYERVPVDLELAGGGRSTLLATLRSGCRLTIDLARTVARREP